MRARYVQKSNENSLNLTLRRLPSAVAVVEGRAFLAFLTDRFTVREVIGKTVVIHDSPDDFTTQPAGNAGNKIACGVISEVRR